MGVDLDYRRGVTDGMLLLLDTALNPDGTPPTFMGYPVRLVVEWGDDDPDAAAARRASLQPLVNAAKRRYEPA